LPVGGTISCLTTFTPISAGVITLTTTADSSTPDSNANNNTATTLVDVGQVTPQPDSATTPINTPVSINVVANDGASGTTIDPSSVSVPASGPGAPAHGSVSCNGAGVCTYTPNTDYSGTDTFNYTVCDTAEPRRCGTTTVTVVVGPKANDDGASTPINTPLNGNVTGNDHYPPNSTFTATSVPGHGSVTMNADGSYTYTPAANYSGPDSFTYKVCEPEPNETLCSTATVNITVGNGTLSANPDSASTPYATAVTSSVLTNDTASGAPIDPSSLSVVGNPANGTASCDTSGHCTYTPNAGFSGTDTYTYRVCDQTTPTPNCATAVVTVVVGPQANDDSATTSINTPVNANAASNDHYPPNSTFTATSAPGHGTVTMNADGSYTYTPAVNYSGPDSFTYKVCEPEPNQALCSTATVHITVGNGTLSANPDSAQTPFNTPVKIDVLANDSSNGAPLDPSTLAAATTPVHGAVSCDATGCTYTPNTGYTGTDTFIYTICDKTTPTANCTTATVTVQVGPKANDDALTTSINTPKNGTVATNDVYPPGSTFTQVTPPGHGTLTLATDGSYTYTPANNYTGTDTFTYKVCEAAPNQALCSTAMVTVNVGAGVADMAASAATTQTVSVNTPLTVVTRCTNNGPQIAVNATCAVTGVASAATVCTPGMPVAALAVGAVITCTTSFTPAQAGTYTLTTTAASDTPDSNAGNNVASSVVTVTAVVPTDPPVPAPIDARWMLTLMALLLGASAATRARSIRSGQ
ncbi:Ig-like domain-containing protein, partial [Rudaea sp.]|uniref:Ig-like domain-containing protein n=1 Tax=Rudaea sp. TaxID=2136325 RepID=UPI002ECFBA74